MRAPNRGPSRLLKLLVLISSLLTLVAVLSDDAHAQERDPEFVYHLGAVAQACGTADVFGSLAWCADPANVDQVAAPELQAVVDACENDFSALEIVLVGFGWSLLPPDPNVGSLPTFQRLGAWALNPARPGWADYPTDLQVGWAPGHGLACSNKSGTVGYLDVVAAGAPAPTLNPSTMPVLDWRAGDRVLNVGSAAKRLTQNAGSLGGFAWIRPIEGGAGRWVAGVFDFYNTASLNNLGIVYFAADLSLGLTAGAYRIGPANVSWTCPEFPNINCAKWYDPVNLVTFHANKAHE